MSDRIPGSSHSNRLCRAEATVSEKLPTLTLAVTLAEGETDVQVDFQRDPKHWTEVRDAILVGIERLQCMIAEQGGCPARPKAVPVNADAAAKELLRCHFCGGHEPEAQVARSNDPHDRREFWAVYCPSCEARGPLKIDLSVACEAWNLGCPLNDYRGRMT